VISGRHKERGGNNDSKAQRDDSNDAKKAHKGGKAGVFVPGRHKQRGWQ